MCVKKYMTILIFASYFVQSDLKTSWNNIVVYRRVWVNEWENVNEFQFCQFSSQRRRRGRLGAWVPWRGWPSRGQRCDAGSGRWQLGVTLHTGCHPHQAGRERDRDSKKEKVDKVSEKNLISVCVLIFTSMFAKISEDEDILVCWGEDLVLGSRLDLD